MSSKSSFKAPDFDPYDVLGIEPGSTDAVITKAYRKLALKLHPDKQKNLSPSEAEKVAKRFHDVKEARSFLMDAEHQEDRRKFDAKRASDKLRREADQRREQTMSSRRKNFRDELKQKEAKAAAARADAAAAKSSPGHSSSAPGRNLKRKNQDLMDQLRRENKKMREAQADKEIMEELKRQTKLEKSKVDALEERQVRLKWDRKKVRTSHSEHSIASLLSKFGHVEAVEFLGSKGNNALVTFSNPLSCRPCVEHYATSDEMRAKFVGKRKDREEEEVDARESVDVSPKSSARDGESLNDRRLRQAAEREKLLRQMEEEEITTGEKGSSATGATPPAAQPARVAKPSNRRPFPIPFPETKELQNLKPIQKLETFEREILGNLLSAEALRSIQVSR